MKYAVCFFVLFLSSKVQAQFPKHLNLILERAEEGDKSAQNVARMAMSFLAKETCSCLWVMNLKEEDCAKGRPKLPVKVNVKPNFEEKKVVASALFMSETASYKGVQEGCLLQRKP